MTSPSTLVAMPQMQQARVFVPPMDLVEADQQYNMSLELPGCSKDDVHVNVEENMLTISAEKRQEQKEDNEKFHKTERMYGKMQRSIRLPGNANKDEINAAFNDGVLKVTIPKLEQTQQSAPQAKTVPVN